MGKLTKDYSHLPLSKTWLGKLISVKRKENKLSPTQLDRRLGIKRSYWRYEVGQTIPFALMVKIALMYNLDLNWFKKCFIFDKEKRVFKCIISDHNFDNDFKLDFIHSGELKFDKTKLGKLPEKIFKY